MSLLISETAVMTPMLPVEDVTMLSEVSYRQFWRAVVAVFFSLASSFSFPTIFPKSSPKYRFSSKLNEETAVDSLAGAVLQKIELLE